MEKETKIMLKCTLFLLVLGLGLMVSTLFFILLAKVTPFFFQDKVFEVPGW